MYIYIYIYIYTLSDLLAVGRGAIAGGELRGLKEQTPAGLGKDPYPALSLCLSVYIYIYI